jgi:hypothetical protein
MTCITANDKLKTEILKSCRGGRWIRETRLLKPRSIGLAFPVHTPRLALLIIMSSSLVVNSTSMPAVPHHLAPTGRTYWRTKRLHSNFAFFRFSSHLNVVPVPSLATHLTFGAGVEHFPSVRNTPLSV